MSHILISFYFFANDISGVTESDPRKAILECTVKLDRARPHFGRPEPVCTKAPELLCTRAPGLSRNFRQPGAFVHTGSGRPK